MRWRYVVLVVVVSTMVLHRGYAQRAPATKVEPAKQVVFVGLLPLDKPKGTGDLVELKSAQDTRVVIEDALAKLSTQPVVGHEALSARLGNGYLPRWFACRTDVRCLVKLLGPLRSSNYSLAITAEYYRVDDNAHVHIVAFSPNDGKIATESQFDVAVAELGDPKVWLDNFRPVFASRMGRIKITSSVADTTCTLDGAPCTFEPDGQTITASPGEHTLELSKQDYTPEKVTVSVETGVTQEVAIALKPVSEAKNVEEGGAKMIMTANGPRHAPSLLAVRTDKVITIDGKLDEAAWQKAWIETNFIQHYPDEAKGPTERTELRVLYDDESIYVGVRCYDSQPDKIVAQLTRRDRDIEADYVTVDISSKNDRSSAYTFRVNAAGVQLDGTRFSDIDSSTNLDNVWYSDVSLDDKGWIAEIEIPLADLRYSGAANAFGFQVRRYIQRRKETDEWAYVPSDAQGEVSYYGTLENLNGLNAKRLFQLTPYEARRATFRTKQGPLDGTTFDANLGADLKLGLTPGLTLDATVYPDFGTVEVDALVFNLTTLETFYPEKRPFFLEGADLFDLSSRAGIIGIGTPPQLFYTRRIGRTPPDQRISNTLVEPPPTGEIIAAGKVSGIVAGRTSIGVLDAVTAAQSAVIERNPGDPSEKVLVDPLANFAVFRLLQEFGVNSSTGIMATAVNRREHSNLAAPMDGDRCPLPHRGLLSNGPVDGRCSNNAYAVASDTALRTEDGTWGAAATLFGSVLERGPSRRVPDGEEIKPGDLGYGVNAELGKYGGKHLLYAIHFLYMSPKLEINDAGFADEVNKIVVKQVTTLRSTKKVLGLRNGSLKFGPDISGHADIHPYTSGLGHAGLSLVAKGTFANFWTAYLQVSPSLSAYNNRETRDGALLQTPKDYGLFADFATDPGARVSADLSGSANQTARGRSLSSSLTISTRPVSFIELDLVSNVSWSYGDPRWISTTENPDASRTYLFADLDSRSFDVTVRGSWTFSPQLSLQTYAQLYLDGGHFGNATQITASGTQPHLDLDQFTPAMGFGNDGDFRDTGLNVNAFLRWEFRPGSAFWLVYTRSQVNLPYDPMLEGPGRLGLTGLVGPSTDVVLAKLSYMWQPLSHKR